jgi:uncharacterized protein (TIGR00725 family)
MKIKVGVMGSAGAEPGGFRDDRLRETAARLGQSLAAHNLILLTGGTTGLVYVVGKAAHDAGVFHVGVSPASFEREHVERYKLPTDACDLLIYTGFGLKGRNVVLVRSCDIVIFIAGAIGSLNEFTIAHDEGKVIGCLKGSGGVADAADYLLKNFSKRTEARVFEDSNADTLLISCLAAVHRDA